MFWIFFKKTVHENEIFNFLEPRKNFPLFALENLPYIEGVKLTHPLPRQGEGLQDPKNFLPASHQGNETVLWKFLPDFP